MRRRGVSPVVSILLIVAVVASSVFTLYIWISSFQSRVQEGVEREGRVRKHGFLDIEKVRLFISVDALGQVDTVELELWFRNMCEIPVHVDAVYLTDSKGGVCCLRLDNPLVVEPGEIGYLNVFGGIDVVSGWGDGLKGGDTVSIRLGSLENIDGVAAIILVETKGGFGGGVGIE